MYRLMFLVLVFLIVSCNTAPQIIPDPPPDSPIVMKLKHDINAGEKITFWGWILWYIPVLFMVVAWTYKEFFHKSKKSKQIKEENQTEE